MPSFTPAQIACLIVVAIATVTDLRSHKIPNILTFPAAAAGVVLQLIAYGPQGALWAVEGWALAVAVMLLTRLFGWPFGMGDVKLIAAVGSFVGPAMVMLVFLYFFLSLAPVAWYRILAAMPWRQIIGSIPSLIKTGNWSMLSGMDWSRFNKARKSPLLFGPFYATGTLCAILFEQPTRTFLGLR